MLLNSCDARLPHDFAPAIDLGFYESGEFLRRVAGSFGFGGNLKFGPGRHGPGHALFGYFRDPDGHRIEVFNMHYQMMDIENEPVRWDLSYMRNRPWGFPPRRTWFEEASRFLGVEPRDPPKKGNPMTLERFLMEDGIK